MISRSLSLLLSLCLSFFLSLEFYLHFFFSSFIFYLSLRSRFLSFAIQVFISLFLQSLFSIGDSPFPLLFSPLILSVLFFASFESFFFVRVFLFPALPLSRTRELDTRFCCGHKQKKVGRYLDEFSIFYFFSLFFFF